MSKIIFKIVEHYPESKRILIRFARKHSDKPIDEYPKFITSYDKNSIDLFDTESFITSLVSSSGMRRINKMEKQQEVLRENIPDEIASFVKWRIEDDLLTVMAQFNSITK